MIQEPLLVTLSYRSRTMALVAVLVLGSTMFTSYTPVHAAGDCTVSSSDLAMDSEEQAFLTDLNVYRAQYGVGPLSVSPTLTQAAAWMTRDMVTKNYFSHTDSLGRNSLARTTDCGYTNVYAWRGENAALGYTTGSEVLQGWEGSPSHNDLMLDGKYVAAGISRAYDTSSGAWSWILDVASILDTGASKSPPTATTVPPSATPTRTPTSMPASATPVPSTATRTATTVPATSTNVPPSATPTATQVPPSPTRTATTVPPTATATAGAQFTSGERLTNGGFESGLTGWDRPSWFGSSADVVSSPTHTGSTAFRFQGKTSGPYIQQVVPASPGQMITASGWVQVAARNAAMSGAVELVVLNGSNGVVATYPIYSFTSTTSGWVPFTGSHLLPNGTAAVELRVRFPNLDGTVYLDDLSLR